MMQQKRNTVVKDVMNKSHYSLLRALLITFAFVNLVGIVWYIDSLSKITLLSGAISCIAAFIFGISDFQTKTSVFRSFVFIVFAIAGITASIIRIFYDTNMFCDIWGAVPHVLPLILFAVVLKMVLRKQ